VAAEVPAGVVTVTSTVVPAGPRGVVTVSVVSLATFRLVALPDAVRARASVGPWPSDRELDALLL
jgi:hypothetical protein